MTFTVGLPGGMRDFEFEAYVRLLEKNGVNVANTPRVVDPVSGKMWLYAWKNQAEAEKFAADLRQETEDSSLNISAGTECLTELASKCSTTCRLRFKAFPLVR